VLREWPVNYFREFLKRLLDSTSHDYILVGGTSETQRISAISAGLPGDRVFQPPKWLHGVENLPILFANARAVIGNESGPIHLAAAMDVPFVCISNGNHFGRFHPYPPSYGIRGTYCYPFGTSKDYDPVLPVKEKLDQFSAIPMDRIPVDVVERETLALPGIERRLFRP
jgi:ADP-heptose:LPS heptosyltransferase